MVYELLPSPCALKKHQNCLPRKYCTRDRSTGRLGF
uniref:Uncharacterized protein n=1 Tax=Setaria viridis TaxID=4556 RepID=A0A4U6SVX3_SETVI|nr:hypothetical protein SEVIR_9G199450v2 [Setaria viridis]